MKDSTIRLFHMAGEHKGKMLRSVALATLSVALGILPLFIMFRVIANLLHGSADFVSTSLFAILAGICLILKSITFARATFLSHQAAYRILYSEPR